MKKLNWVGLTHKERHKYDYLGPDMALIVQYTEDTLRLKNGDPTLQTVLESCLNSLDNAVQLRVALWRNGDLDGDDDHLTDEQVAKKDSYARVWSDSASKLRLLLKKDSSNDETN